MQIHGFNKTTILDYPKHLACTIFLGNCNFRCPFCHNASLVLTPNTQPTMEASDVLDTIRKRKGILEGVCITGGEPTLSKDLPAFIASIKDLGLNVKLDTNGSNPLMLAHLLENRLIDYVAMDIKNSQEKYSLTSGVDVSLDAINESMMLLKESGLPYEYRTTVVKEFHTLEDMISIGTWIKGAKAYYLQTFEDSGDTILPGLHAHTKTTMERFKEVLLPYCTTVQIRGMD